MVMVTLFLNNINRSSNELVTTRKTQTQTYLRNIEQQLDNIYMQQVNLINRASVTKLAYSIYANDYEKSQLILELIKNIEDIQGMNLLIEDIIITFPNQSITVSSNNGYEKKIIKAWDKVESGTEYNYLITYDGKIVLNFTYPLMYSVSEDYIPDYNIQVILSKEVFSELLSIFGDSRDSGAAIWFRLNNEYIIGNEYGTVVEGYVDEVKEGTGEGVAPLVKEHGDYKFISTDSMKYPLTVVAFISREVITQIKVKYITVLTVLILAISSMFIFSLIYTKRIVVKPLREMMMAFGKIQDGDFDVRIYHEPHDEFNYLYHGFNDAVAYIQALIANIYEQENLIQNAELAQLQSQINPHFLYNSFFIINRMAKNEAYEQITKFVISLAKYYRFINKETNNFIPLTDEVEHMVNYMDIQQMRFGDKISVELEELPEEMKQVLVPKLILQPIIENAYNYGLANKLEDGLIRVSYRQEESLVFILIEDNGEDADNALIERVNKRLDDDVQEDNNHALVNINKRLVLAYGKHCGLSIELSNLGGLKVLLKVDSDVELY